jgi:hypothetical protein
MTMTEAINVRQLAEIENRLAGDTLTDEEIVAALADAGLPEVARVIARFTKSQR